MVHVYIALAIGAMSLPIAFPGLDRISPGNALTPGFDLPEVDRLDTVVPLPHREFDDTLPNFIEPPTPVVEMAVLELNETERTQGKPSAAPPIAID